MRRLLGPLFLVGSGGELGVNAEDAVAAGAAPQLGEEDRVPDSKFWRPVDLTTMEDALVAPRAKHVLLHVWGHLCAPCKQQRAAFEKVGKKLLAETPGGEIDLIAIDKDDIPNHAIATMLTKLIPKWVNAAHPTTGSVDNKRVWTPSLWWFDRDIPDDLKQVLPPYPRQTEIGDKIRETRNADKNMHKYIRHHIHEVVKYKRVEDKRKQSSSKAGDEL